MSGRLDGLRVPGEEDARRRAWAVARAALAEREPRRRGAATRVAPVLAGILLVLALAAALTAPGRAAAQWVQDRIAAVAQRPASPAPAARVPSTAPLPGGGRLLVVDASGPKVLGLPGGPRRLLGAVDDATWSPHGRYVAAVRGAELIAVDLGGHRRWHVAARGPVRAPRWAPSGFRVAYLTGAGRGRVLRVVAGDGTGDRAVAAAAAAPPAWHPGSARNVLAHVGAGGRLVVRDVDSGQVLWRVRPREAPRALVWSADGRRLVAVGARAVSAYGGAGGRLLGRRRAPHGTENVTAAFAPSGRRYVVLRRLRATGDHRVLLVSGGRERLLQVGSGPLTRVAWAPDGRRLILDRRGAPTWSLMRLGPRGPGIERQVAPGRGARLAGWCCS